MSDAAQRAANAPEQQSPRIAIHGLSEDAPAARYLPRGLGPLVVALVGILMCTWTWNKWCDPIIDFGREVYVPWRLSEGDVLYRDIVSYFNGPLTPYAHAVLFGVFGVSLRTLVVFNLLLIALLVTMLYRLVARVSDDLCATAAGVAFLVLFAFAQFVPTGNYNYVCPYSYELPHGITLTVAGITFLSTWVRRDRWTWLALSGAMLGLVALTKAEVFLAAAVALAVGFVAAVVTLKRARARSVMIFFGAAIVPPFVAFALLLLVLSPGEAVRGVLGSWVFVGRRELTDLPYFRQLAGTDDVRASLLTILKWTADYVLLLVPGVVVAFLVRRGRNATILTSLALAGVALSLGRYFMFRINWLDVIRPAPLVLAVACFVLVARLIHTRDARLVLPLTLTVWAGAMLAKMPLNAHIYHYGFALAMPATLMLIVILLGWVPRALEHRHVNGWPLRATVLAALVVVMWAYAYPMRFFFEEKTVPVGSGADRFYADFRGILVNNFVAELSRRSSADETLVMLPEGLIVNYLTRRINPTGQLNFTPPAFIMYGESAMVDAFRHHPPDLVGRFDVDTSEYGARRFGFDYGRGLDVLIRSNYEPVVGRPYVQLLRRRAITPDKPPSDN